MSLSLDDVTEGLKRKVRTCHLSGSPCTYLYKPAASSGVPPAIKARDGAVCYQKVSMVGDLVGGGSSISLCSGHVDTMVQLVTLTSLQDKQVMITIQLSSQLPE